MTSSMNYWIIAISEATNKRHAIHLLIFFLFHIFYYYSGKRCVERLTEGWLHPYIHKLLIFLSVATISHLRHLNCVFKARDCVEGNNQMHAMRKKACGKALSRVFFAVTHKYSYGWREKKIHDYAKNAISHDNKGLKEGFIEFSKRIS